MRTAVVRVNIDPEGRFAHAWLREGMVVLLGLAGEAGVGMVESDLTTMPTGRREVQLLIAAEDADAATRTAIELCTNAFGGSPSPGVVTFVSRGTDDDAHGVLAGFGLTGEIVRTPGDDGYDIVNVTLREEDLDRIPESRVHTALEASLNCEVHIRTR
ncbi:MAG TPA: hypothetical protein VMB04_16015 [Mycobacterium sp.]|nr:hypothetical protein [Mycobacterium sp.]